ncbi:hypothetical protein [Richelia intracellularis]|nr:hypothetical protein [Richelia intracellularis]
MAIAIINTAKSSSIPTTFQNCLPLGTYLWYIDLSVRMWRNWQTR